MQPPRWRRWLVRLLVLVAFVGVCYGLYRIVDEGLGDDPATDSPEVSRALDRLEGVSETLAQRLDRLLRPSTSPRPAREAARRALAAQERAVAALEDLSEPDQELEDALNAEFDWLDGVYAALRTPRSRVVGQLGKRGEAAIEAWDDVGDDHGMADTVRGVSRLTTWAQAQ